jgi:hypothetical protein
MRLFSQTQCRTVRLMWGRKIGASVKAGISLYCKWLIETSGKRGMGSTWFGAARPPLDGGEHGVSLARVATKGISAPSAV